MSMRWLWGSGRAVILAALACGLARAADDEPSIKVPVKAKVLIGNRVLTGTVVSVTEKEVEFQSATSTRPTKYKAGTIKAIETADDLYVWSAAKSRYEAKGKEGAGKSKANPDARFVVAQGTGKDAEEATANARREALRQVVTSLIGSAAYARAEKVIADKVLAAADELVKGKQELQNAEDKEGRRVRLLATVDTRALTARLKDAGLKLKDGPRGTGTSLPSEQEIKDHGADILAEVLADLQLTLVGDVLKVSDEDGALSVQIRLSTDKETYGHVVRQLEKVLDVIRLGKEQVPVAVRGVPGEAGHFRSGAGALKGSLSSKGTNWNLWVMTEAGGLPEKTVWEINQLGVDRAQGTAPVKGRLHALVTALGPDRQPAGVSLIPLEPPSARLFTEPGYKWLMGHLPPTTSQSDQVFLSPLALQMTQLKANQAFEGQLETRHSLTVNLKAIQPRQVTGVFCNVVLLPD